MSYRRISKANKAMSGLDHRGYERRTYRDVRVQLTRSANMTGRRYYLRCDFQSADDGRTAGIDVVLPLISLNARA